MIPDPRKEQQPSDFMRFLQAQGLTLQPQRHVRDQEEIFTTLLDAVLNDASYIGKVQHLIELYGAAYTHTTKETQAKLDAAFEEIKTGTPTYNTAIAKVGTEGTALIVQQEKAHGARSHLPLNSSEHYRIFMDSERENSHMRIYLKLVKPLGNVLDDLVAKDYLPRKFASNLRKVDLSDLESVPDAPKPR